MRAHPVAALFPSLEGADFDQFVADIREHGLREPIKTWNGVLIDGRNRERACKAAGIEPRHKEIKFADEYEAIAYIISENLHRRHLDTGQRAMLGEELRPRLAAAAKQRQKAAGGDKKSAKAKSVPLNSGEAKRSGEVDHQLADMLKVGHDSMAKAHKIKAEAPELAAKVRSGEITLHAAYTAIKEKKRRPHRNPEITPAKEEALARAVLDDGMSLEDASASFALGSVQVAKIAVAKERARRELKAATDPAIPLSMSAQERLDAAIRRAEHKLEVDFELRVQRELKRALDETVLPAYHRELDEAREIIKSRKGLMDRATYTKIRNCLHSDRIAPLKDAALSKRFDEAFHLFSKLENLLLDEKEKPTESTQVPRTWAEMMKARMSAKWRRAHSNMQNRY